MAVEPIDLNLEMPEIPEDVSRLFREANRRIDDFFETERNRRYPKFIPSDSELLYAALHHITRNGLALGNVYCEWGSGFGFGICLAALLGYDAYGIEIEPELVELSRKLAGDLGIGVNVLEGSYMPDGYESYAGVGGEELVEPDGHLHSVAENGRAELKYDGMDLEIDEIDLFYVFPWPGEQEFMLEFFDSIAAEGAILLAYFGDRDLCAFRRVFQEAD